MWNQQRRLWDVAWPDALIEAVLPRAFLWLYRNPREAVKSIELVLPEPGERRISVRLRRGQRDDE